MTDSRSRFEAWEKNNIPEWLPENGPARLFARHAWQAAEAETARKCIAIVEGSKLNGIRSVLADEIRQAFK